VNEGVWKWPAPAPTVTAGERIDNRVPEPFDQRIHDDSADAGIHSAGDGIDKSFAGIH
jgi:hypothetical protein